MGRLYTKTDIARYAEKQEHICPYCTLPFGTVVSHHGDRVQSPVGDHFIPFTWAGNAMLDNLIVCCQLCNKIKSATIFDSVEQARRHILIQRMNKNIITLFIPETPMTEDAAKWAAEYGRFLAE